MNITSNLADVGQLLNIYMDEIVPKEGMTFSAFTIQTAAKLLQPKDQRNWVPLIVKQIQPKQYQVTGNSLVYAVADIAGLERVWCVVTDSTKESEEIAQVLSGEAVPRINLSTASHDDINLAFQHLLAMPTSPLKGIKLQVVVSRIDEAPRQYWKDLTPITTLKCGITKGKKLDALAQVFYLTPQPISEFITDSSILSGLTMTELKTMAKKRGISGYTKLKKNDLVEQLSQI
jgi:hypothetical protein